MKTATFVILIVGVLGALLWYMPGSPIRRFFPTAVVVPPSPDQGAPAAGKTLKIVTVLSKDAIPAILDPTFVSGAEAEAQMTSQSTVIGLSINGDHRAYSTAHLNSHEVVNDTVGGVPVAVTW